MTASQILPDVAALDGKRFVVVSNRQPFAHVRHRNGLRVEKAPSGLALALEPIVQAARGTWIASASGNADGECVDAAGRVVDRPPGVEYYSRRVFLPARLQQDYYNGFANSTMWPLCHIAFHQPKFEERWWRAYLLANRMFAAAVADEIGQRPAIVFVQDFHFAMLPLMLRERCPQAVIAQFWHIPWPNAEVFRLCPWRREILEGLLGNDLLGFHLPNHRDNFIDTVDRELQVRVEHETHSVLTASSRTTVSAFPISVDFPHIYAVARQAATIAEARELHRRHAPGQRLVVSVERLDYTKGIRERLAAIERLFERHPEWIGKAVFVHVATPSRTGVRAYCEYQVEIEREVERINERFSTAEWSPLRALHAYLDPERVWTWYQAADAVIVSSLHDGMNLVSKEFVAAGRDDAVLVLSEFAGAARELREAVLINPYATDDFADALARALGMPSTERRERMSRLRWRVSQHDIGDWAHDILRAIRQHEFDAHHSPSLVETAPGSFGLADSVGSRPARAVGE